MTHFHNPELTQIVEAPATEYEKRSHQLFLIGGISNCPDWQSIMIQEIGDYPNLTIFNPRRKDYPHHDRQAAKEQRYWEFNRLAESTAIAAWFSRGSLNPIALYELGMWVNSRPHIPACIGIDPEYERHDDVIDQTEQARPEIQIVSSIGALALQTKELLLPR